MEHYLTQAEFMRNYNDSHREQFNPKFFIRDNQEMMDCVKKIIKSCERDKYFTLKVVEMREVYDYEEIYNILREYTDSKQRNKNKNKGKKKLDNIYDYINIRDSDIMLLVVKYFIRHNGTEKQEVPKEDGTPGKVAIDVKDPYTILTVLIALPRFSKKYYFRLNGNYYTSTFQIVDGSTYNNANTNTNSKKMDCITFKTLFMPVRIYKMYKDMTDIITNKTVRNTLYTSNIFNYFVHCMYYILANFGLYETYNFLDIHCIYMYYEPPSSIFSVNSEWYCFQKHNIYICVSKNCCQYDPMVQSLVATIYEAIQKDTQLDDLYNIRFWIMTLGLAFKGTSNPIDRGLFVLDSVDGIYDIITKEQLHLPEELKQNIYQILRWIMREFLHLRNKDNVDVTLKRVRIAEYAAHIYATQLSKGLHRVSYAGKRVTLNSVIKAVRTDPMFVISKIINMSNLVSYVDLVNDNDAMLALKYTYKGISGLGENGTSIQGNYRYVDVSHVGILDLDTSSVSDPGMSGIICPMAELHGNSFTEYEEPNYWYQDYYPYHQEWHNRYPGELKKPVYFDPDFKSEEDEEEEGSQYNKLRREVVKSSLQIDEIHCPVFGLLDNSVIYSNAEKLIEEEKNKPNIQQIPVLFTVRKDDDNNGSTIL